MAHRMLARHESCDFAGGFRDAVPWVGTLPGKLTQQGAGAIFDNDFDNDARLTAANADLNS
jgi:hypothetical protein